MSGEPPEGGVSDGAVEATALRLGRVPRPCSARFGPRGGGPARESRKSLSGRPSEAPPSGEPDSGSGSTRAALAPRR